MKPAIAAALAAEPQRVVRDLVSDGGSYRDLVEVPLVVAADPVDHLRAVIREFCEALDETTSELVPASLMRPRLAAAAEALRVEAAPRVSPVSVEAGLRELGREYLPRADWKEQVLLRIIRDTPPVAPAPPRLIELPRIPLWRRFRRWLRGVW